MIEKQTMHIAGRKIGSGEPPYIIAEMSANHDGKIENAFRILEEAKRAGADAVKLQTYTADTITLNCENEDFQIHGGLWDGWTLYRLYECAHMPWDWHQPLFDYAQKIGITIFSTPFDTTAVDFLEKLNVPAYKIASFEIIDLPLIKYVANTGKPMIISTGMANVNEIEEAIAVAEGAGNQELALLHCVSGYPAPASDYNLLTIPDLIQRFGRVTGLSDHTVDNTIALASISLGASIIEKHFTLNRQGGGPDDIFSIEPLELSSLCQDIHTVYESLGRVDYGYKSSEIQNVKFRRSLYFVKDMKKGDIITSDTIRSVRPGYGLSPKYYDMIIGKCLSVNIQKYSPVLSHCIDNFSI